MECIFVSDLHGRKHYYTTLFNIINKEEPDAIFFGGDLLPNHLTSDAKIHDFLSTNLFEKISKTRQQTQKNIRFFMILGNDDPKKFEHFFEIADQNHILDYIHNKKTNYKNHLVFGYSYVPPTPFLLKDWERYDVSRFIDVGSIAPENGIRTINISVDELTATTIADDLEHLTKDSPMQNSIFLFHSPPYKSYLDQADLQGKMIDHVPLDIHVGSIAIHNFIKNKQPLLTLHGHVHESARLSGLWQQKIGRTHAFSAAHDGKELSVIRFNTQSLKDATRELITVT